MYVNGLGREERSERHERFSAKLVPRVHFVGSKFEGLHKTPIDPNSSVNADVTAGMSIPLQ